MGEISSLSAPEPLAAHHEYAQFSSGVTSLDDWLKRRARANQASGASRTYVLCDGLQVVAYFAIASGAVQIAPAPGRFRRNLPDPIPVVILGRLAVDRQWQGHGIGRALVRDAGRRVTLAAEIVGIRGIVVHALSDDAKRFYFALGFEESPLEPITLMITLDGLRSAME